MEAMSSIYDENFFLTDDFQNCQETIPIPYSEDANRYGFDHVKTPESGLTFGYGLYRVTIGYDENNSIYEFYLDWRDCDYSDFYNGMNDIWILFDDYWQSCKICWNHQTKDPSSWEFIENGQVYRIWEKKYKSVRNGIQNTTRFPNFWKNCLVLLESESNNPRLVWGKYPSFEATNYKIYRAVSSVPNPRNLSYSLIHTTSSANVFEYTDKDLSLGNFDYVYYYVVAYNSATNTNSEPSNVITTRAGMYKQAIENNENPEPLTDFVLKENYPNPFNPTTTISYSIPIVGAQNFVPVQLKVYDVLGRKVATLVNEQKPAGIYEVKFDASDLSSGIYFYSLEAGLFAQTRKMILLR